MQSTVCEQKIVEAAYRLFKRQGIRSTHLNDVAYMNGIPVKTLRQLFHGKKDLVLAVMEQALKKIERHLQRQRELSPNAVAEMDSFFKLIENINCTLTPSILYEIRKYYAEAWYRFTDFRENILIPHLNENIKRGISEGSYRTDLSTNEFGTIYLTLLQEIIESPAPAISDNSRAVLLLHRVLQHGIKNRHCPDLPREGEKIFHEG